MRKPKALVIPFRFREGYPDDIVDQHLVKATHLLDDIELEYTLTENVIFDQEADLVSSKYNPHHFDFIILLVPTWIEPVLVIRAVKTFIYKPVIVWGFGTFIHGGERVNLGSMPGSGVVKGTLREMGIKHEFIYRLPGDPDIDKVIKDKIQKIANVSRAIALLKQSRILSIGYQFGGMTLGDMDLTRMRMDFGPDLVEKDAYSLIRRIEEIDGNSPLYLEEKKFVGNFISNSIGDKLDRIVRMYAALKQFMDENHAQAITIKCHFELSQEFGLTACVPLSVLGNSVVASCEADIPVTLTQLIMHYLSGGGITTYADIHEILEDRILVGACGFAPAGMCIGNKIICDLPCADAVGLGATFKDYITNKNYLKQGPVTLARVLKEKDARYSLHVATGEAVGDVGKVSELGAPQYPFTEIVLGERMDRFSQNLGSHHYAILHSDIGQEIELFCKYMDLDLIRD